MHPELTHSDRMTALRNARRYLGGSSGPVQKPGQTAMDSFLDRQEESSFEEELPVAPKTPVIVPTGRTTQLLRYDVETEQTLLDFRGWLQIVDGRMKAASTALQEARDVAKFLHAEKAKGEPIDWSVFTSRDKLNRYVERNRCII